MRTSSVCLVGAIVLGACSSESPSGAGAGSGADAGAGGGADGGAGGGGAALSCSDVKGAWKLAAWSCAGTPVDTAAYGVELTMEYPTSTDGTWSMKLFVPITQQAVWYARTQGRKVTYSGSNVTLTKSAPVESCSTTTGSGADWGPVNAGTGVAESCRHNTGPGGGGSTTYACKVAGNALELSVAAPAQEGPCKAGDLSVERWERR